MSAIEKMAAFLLVALLLACAVTSPADARSARTRQVPNGTALGCAMCHVNAGGGGARNAFGLQVEVGFLSQAGFAGVVLWGPELAALDADGDGATNGQELGDPDGIWVQGDANPEGEPFRPWDAGSTPPSTVSPPSGEDPQPPSPVDSPPSPPSVEDPQPMPVEDPQPPPPGDVSISVPSYDDWLASEDSVDLNGDGAIDEEDFELFIDSLFDGREAPGPDPLFELLGKLAEKFDDEPKLLIDPLSLSEELDDRGAVDFLLRLAGFDGLLSRKEVLSVVQDGPLSGEGNFPRLDRLEGVLEGIDMEERLIFVNGEAFVPAEDVRIIDRQERSIDVFTLLELAGALPKVELAFNRANEVASLRLLSRFNGAPMGGENVEFFGPLSLVDGRKIILQGPRFQVTSRTRLLDKDNKPVSLENAPLGQEVSVTPGPPDAASGSFDPVATKVQLINPNRPPPASANIVVGNLIGYDGQTLELAGPIADWNAETRFADFSGVSVKANEIASGSFIRIVTRAPTFGETRPVAVEVEVLESGAFDPPTAEGKLQERSQDEIRIEGFVGDVGRDFIVLAGARLLLSTRAQFFDISGKLTDSGGIFAGDMVEIDTQPDGRGGFSVTRVRAIDPAVQGVNRPGVIIAPFDAVEGNELVLAGQFFAFSSDVKVAGQGGRSIGVGDLAGVEYVRLTASPPRFDRGETLPVVFDIRVVRAPEAPPELQDGPAVPDKGKRNVIASFPEDGDVGISNFTQVEAVFDGNVSDLLFDPEFEFSIFPEPLSFGDLEISATGRSISAEVQLEDNRSYQLVVISKLTGFYSIRFTTGDQIGNAAVVGRIIAPQELPPNARFVESASFAVLISDVKGDVASFEDIEESVVAGVPLQGKEFTIDGVDPGSYYLVAFVVFDLGRGEFVEFEAVFDSNGDGVPDLIELAGDRRSQVDLALTLPEALSVVALSPTPRTAGIPTQTDIEIEFNQPALLALDDILILPPPLSAGELMSSQDGSAYALSVELEEDVIYRVVVQYAEDLEGGALLSPSETVFTTGIAFAELLSIRGRLVLPDLPASRRFDGPLFVGAVPASLLAEGTVSFETFSEGDIVATAITTSPDFAIEDVPPGAYLVAAFARVEVPRGFRAPDPRQRSLGDFDIARQGRFSEQVLEVFDAIELFGIYDGDGGGVEPVAAGEEGIELFLKGQSKTRAELLLVDEFLIRGEPLGSAEELPIVDSGNAQLSVRFNKPLRSDRGIVAIEASLNGKPLRTFTLSEDGRGVTFDAVFDEDRFHRFTLFKAEAKDGSRLERPLDVGFTTGASDIGFSSLSGRVSLQTRSDDGQLLTGDEADVIDEGRVFLFEEDGNELALVGVAEVAEDGQYRLGDIVPGPYQLFAELETASGQEIKAIYDSNGDGLADIVQLVDGSVLSDLDISATVFVSAQADSVTGDAVKTVPSGGNVGAVLSLDLDDTEGNQAETTRSNVEVGQQITVDLHISNAADLSGFAAKLRYDADILDFVSAVDQIDGRTNFLRTEGGLALYLSPLLREPELEFGGAILGATENTAPDGDGFLARFTFEVRQEFEGAQVVLESATLKSITGTDEVEPNISAKLAPPVFEEQKKGVISFDFNSAAGDQEVFHRGFVDTGSLLDVDVYLNIDKIGGEFTDVSNYAVTVEYDDAQLTLISYAPETSEEANMLAAGGGMVPPLPAITGANSITFGSAILGPTEETAPDASGFIGRLTFSTTDAFSETDLLVTHYAVKSVNLAQLEVETIIVGRMSTGEIRRVAASGSSSSSGGGAAANAEGSDFDGDRMVGFGDFFLFADAFGKSAEEAGAAFDLDGSGTVDFGDFFVFADSFGTSLGKRLAADEKFPTLEAGSFDLLLSQVEREIVLSLSARDVELTGYDLEIQYDASAFALERVDDTGSVLQHSGAPSLLLSEEQGDRVRLLGSATGVAPAVDGLLAELHFRPLHPEAEGIFGVVEGRARRAGQLAHVMALGRVQGRWVPRVFALAQNFPNPFNPSTSIRYQLPVDAQVELSIYDVLGQKVRTLLDGERTAGHHTAVWNGRNEADRPVAAGVYFYRLRAGDFVQTRKLLLLK